MRFRKRGKMDRKIPEVVMEMNDVLSLCEKALKRQGITIGSRCCTAVNRKTNEVEIVFQIAATSQESA